MNGPTVDEELDDDNLGSHLGLRAETRVERRANARRTRARRAWGCFAGLLSLAVVGALVAGLAFGFGKGRDYLEGLFSAPDYEGAGKGRVEVEIVSGQTIQSIADTLEKKDVVKSAKAFERAAKDDPRSGKLQAAIYTLREQMSAKAALDLMLDRSKSVLVNRVSFGAGKTKKEVAEILQRVKVLNLKPGAAANALNRPATLGLPKYARGYNPEGFLYPGTYDIPKNANATTILQLMTAEYKKAAAELKLESTARRKQLDPYQAVIVASIVGAEARPDDYAKVARVIYNRLARNMKLQMDSTVHYIAGRSGGVFTTDEQRDIDSPYNTYKYRDLPPTPINSPNKAMLRAAINPAPGDWLYFTLVNVETGETAFARTGEEHQKNVQKLQDWCRANAAKKMC